LTLPSEWIYANVTDDTYNLDQHNTSSLLPPEPDQPESWSAVMAGLFATMAVILFGKTAYNGWINRNRRRDYEIVNELVV
jgi:hypothetical protein